MKGLNDLLVNLRKLPSQMEEAANDVAKDVAPQMEAYAKQNKKWVDRTGHARQGLTGVNYRVPRLYVVCRIYHKVDYAYWLEVIQNGKFAILEETRNKFAGEFFDSIEEAMKRRGVL